MRLIFLSGCSVVVWSLAPALDLSVHIEEAAAINRGRAAAGWPYIQPKIDRTTPSILSSGWKATSGSTGGALSTSRSADPSPAQLGAAGSSIRQNRNLLM